MSLFLEHCRLFIIILDLLHHNPVTAISLLSKCVGDVFLPSKGKTIQPIGLGDEPRSGVITHFSSMKLFALCCHAY